MSEVTPRIDIAFTGAVKAAQQARGSREGYARMAERHDWAQEITDELAGFIAARDSLYLGTASADGRPYIQHRGGPAGFLKTLNANRLGFADYSGNRQYITTGNLSENPQAFIFLMDYGNQRRIKLWGRAEVVVGDAELSAQVADPDYGAVVDQVIVFHVETWDVNCKKHITPRYTVDEFAAS